MSNKKDITIASSKIDSFNITGSNEFKLDNCNILKNNDSDEFYAKDTKQKFNQVLETVKTAENYKGNNIEEKDDIEEKKYLDILEKVNDKKDDIEYNMLYLRDTQILVRFAVEKESFLHKCGNSNDLCN